jgi:hypothetical protein
MAAFSIFACSTVPWPAGWSLFFWDSQRRASKIMAALNEAKKSRGSIIVQAWALSFVKNEMHL